ncbi:MAG: helix-turn-helix transcriptional regulator [Acidobacteria bacterium]|nr:helix-turn-helix transcriptional regulator [Acidobacteriota bacterium]
MQYRTIIESLREGRLLHAMKQADLAQKLGMRQSQISNLERGSVNPRLSMVQDVARVLDFELMLVPRQLVPVVKGLVEAKGEPTEERPLYALDRADDRHGAGDDEPGIS